MSEEARAWAKRQECPCMPSKAILLEIAAMVNMDGTCFPSIRLLATIFKISTRSVQRYIAKLSEAGLLIVAAQSRANGGQTSNLYRLPLPEAYAYDEAHFAPVDERPYDTRVRGGHDTRVTGAHDTRVRGNRREITNTSTSDEVSQRGLSFDDWFEAYPKKVERIGARQLYERIIREGEATPEQLVEGARGYAAAVQGRDPKLVKHPTTWLSRGCWANRPPASAAGWSAPAFEGPAGLRESVRRQRGEAWTGSWLDPCGWDGEHRALIPRTGLARDQLARELREVLREFEVSLTEPQRRAA